MDYGREGSEFERVFPIRKVLKIAGQNSLTTLPPAITAN
jgi:hypothetical protein